jgi:hypothetical protein
MAALVQAINSTTFTNTVIGGYADNGYGFSAVNGKAVSSGTYSVLAKSQTTNVHRVRVNAKPQDGLGIFCSATSYAGGNFQGILFEVKVASGKTFFRLSAVSPSTSTSIGSSQTPNSFNVTYQQPGYLYKETNSPT